jgi:DNA invertase Pin-like site-specific DNA recombinase
MDHHDDEHDDEREGNGYTERLIQVGVPIETDTPGRVIGYCRASTVKQSESPETQKGLIAKYCEFMGLETPKTYYVDPGVSGKVPIGERPAGGVMMGQLKRGDHVVVAKVDRMFRRLSDAASVLDQFERAGIRLHICNLMGGAIDLSSPIGRFLLHILAAFAEMERSFIQERIKDGIARARQKEIRPGRPRFGFKKVKAWDRARNRYVKVCVRDDEERKIMGEIVVMRIQGMTLKQISDEFTFVRKMRTKNGGEWSICRVHSAWRAELLLQAAESTKVGKFNSKESLERFYDMEDEPAKTECAPAQEEPAEAGDSYELTDEGE